MTKKGCLRYLVFGVCIALIFGFSGIYSLSAESFTPPAAGGPPKELGIVQQVATEHPDWLANMYDKYDNPNGTWEFLDEVVNRLHAKDSRWSFNGKRGDPANPSADVIAYYYGPGSAPSPGTINMFEVFLIDIMTFGQPIHWNDVTDYRLPTCVFGAYLYPRTSPTAVPDLPETPPSCDEGGSSDPTDPGTTDDGDVVPPDLTSSGVTVLSGKNPSLAFDPVKRIWLVVAENSGKIQGQFMTEKNKTSGSVLNIGGTDAHTPKIAYGPSVGKYLVVWTSGKDPSAVLWGQLISADGSASGGAIKLASGGAHLYSASNIQYDMAKQNFVLAYEKAGNATEVMLVGVDGSGKVTGPTKLAGVSLKSSAPSIAINTKTHEYCATYLDADKVKIQPVSADGSAGTATQLGEGQDNAGIIYNSTDNSYITAWLTKSGDISSKTVTTCADEPDTTETNLADGVQSGVLVQNTTGYGLFMVNSNRTSDRLISFNSLGETIANQTIFAGAWSTDGLWLSAASNISTGMYGAVASPDTKTVKFVSSIGVPPQGPANSGPITKSTDMPIPDKGLPTNLGQLISAIFIWSLSIIGMVIFVRFFYAGFLWFTAAGNPENISKAKKIMQNAVYGALVLFSAYLILNTINPDLVRSTFNMAGIPATIPVNAPPSETTTDTAKTPTNFCVNNTCTNIGFYCEKEVNCGGIDPVPSTPNSGTTGSATCSYTLCDTNDPNLCRTYCDANHTKPCFRDTECNK